MLRQRLLTAAVLIPVLVATTLYGRGWPFFLLVGAAVLLGAREYARMFFATARERRSGILLTGFVYAAGALPPAALSLPAVLVGMMLAVFRFLAVPGDAAERARRTALAAVGAVYIGGFFSVYPRLVMIPGGEHWVLMGLVAIGAGDTAAYFAGRAFGKRRLAPEVSPNKTVEGAVAGLLISVLLGAAYAAAFLPAVPSWYAAAAAAAVGAVGQGGDLFESLLKRAAGVKDSGGLLPGHGGMLDRVDSLLAAGPPLYILAVLAPLAGSVPGMAAG